MLVDDLISDCDALARRKDCEEIIWHYTSVDSLLRIAESSCVHLSCYSFMNDPAEGLRSPEVLSASWSAAIDAVGKHPKLDLEYIRALSTSLKEASQHRPFDRETFVFSGSVLKDSLSQWARYAADGAGVALGFRVDPTAFDQTPELDWISGPFLHEILYDWGDGPVSKEVPQALVAATVLFKDRLVRLLLEFLGKVRNPTDAENAIYEIAHSLKPLLKQGAYHEEREWRIVAHTVSTSTAIYDLKATRFGMVPYLNLPLGPGIQLKQIMLGPKLPKENLWTAEWLCKKYALEAEISQSAFAYR